MLVVTTPNIEGKPITEYLGLVSGEAILGANIMRDFFAGIRDIVGADEAGAPRPTRRSFVKRSRSPSARWSRRPRPAGRTRWSPWTSITRRSV